MKKIFIVATITERSVKNEWDSFDHPILTLDQWNQEFENEVDAIQFMNDALFENPKELFTILPVFKRS